MGKIEHHDDGSTTERVGDQSITRDSNGNIIESSQPETSWPVPNGMEPYNEQVTRNGEGKVINRQSRS